MKKYTILSFLVLGLSLSISQTEKKIPCYTYEAMEELFKTDPEARNRVERFEKEMLDRLNNFTHDHATEKTSAPPVYTVPVVFHVLHQGGPENVSDQVIINALDQVNKDFERTSSDTNLITPFFKPYYVNSEIVFKLAKRDPNGNCTSGIIHYFDSKTNWSQSSHFSNCVYTWDPTKYMNVYIVNQIVPSGTVTGGGIIVGYTFKPGSWPTGSQADCIVYNYQYLSGGNPPNARSLSHEIGHWLGLSHTWGNTNNPGVSCGDDGITDTPVTKGEFGGCPSSLTTACTQTNPAMAGKNNVENIMNYSGCPRMFTQGQTNLMRNTLQSSVSGRNNLVTASNHTFTAINSTTPCPPIADFVSVNNSYTVCSNQAIQFKDISFNGTVTSWQWGATNGATITNPNASITNITFPNVGTSVVSLTVSNLQGSSVKTRTVLAVNGIATAPTPFSESFESGNTPNNWSVQNLNNGSVTWQVTSLSASHGNVSFLMDGTSSPANHIDILNMPSMDFLSNQGAFLTFKYAYARATTSNNDIFRVQLSNDCGGTWLNVFALSAAQMASGSGGVTTIPFVPNANQWKFYDCSAHPNFANFINSPCVYARFWFKEDENGSGFGNRLYVDEVNFTAFTGVNKFTREVALRIFPNPASEKLSVFMNLGEIQNITFTITDVSGKQIMPPINTTLNAGEQEYSFDISKLSKGIYFLTTEYKGVKMVRKFIKE